MFTWRSWLLSSQIPKKTRASCISTFVPESLFSASLFCSYVTLVFKQGSFRKAFLWALYRKALDCGFSVTQLCTTQFAEGSLNVLSCDIFSGSERGLVLTHGAVENARLCHLIFGVSSPAGKEWDPGDPPWGPAGSAEVTPEKTIMFPTFNWKQCKEQACWRRW